MSEVYLITRSCPPKCLIWYSVWIWWYLFSGRFFFLLQESWEILAFAKMLIPSQISQQPRVAFIPRGIPLKAPRESITVNAVWQVSVIFTALPWHGLMAWASCSLCQRKLPVDPCCSLMPVLSWMVTKCYGKPYMKSTPPTLANRELICYQLVY